MFNMGDAVNPQRIEHVLEDPKAPPHHSIALTPGSLSTEKQSFPEPGFSRKRKGGFIPLN